MYEGTYLGLVFELTLRSFPFLVEWLKYRKLPEDIFSCNTVDSFKTKIDHLFKEALEINININIKIK